MNEEGIRKLLDGQLRIILEAIENTKTELKCAIDSSETRLLMEIESQKQKIQQLENENQYLHQKVESLERRTKTNSIVVYGLNRPTKELDTGYIITEFKKLLDINLAQTDINNFYRLGKSDVSPLKIEFTTYLQKKSILKDLKKLKGTGISIAEDFTEEQRQVYNNLKPYLLKYKKLGKRCFILGNKLVLEDTKYSIDELNNLEEAEKASSAPATPTIASLGDVINHTLQDNSSEITKTPTVSKAKLTEPKPKKSIISGIKTRSNSNSGTLRR